MTASAIPRRCPPTDSRSAVRSLLCFLLPAILCVAPGQATEDDLSAGVFLCHHDPTISYSVSEDDWCAVYLQGYQIDDSEDQRPSILTTEECVWFVLSAFEGEKQWCGTEFGFGDYDPDLFVFTGWGPCTPGEHLELSSDYWPGPGEGTAVVTLDTPWYGHLEPVYYFTGYVDQGYPRQIPLDVDPTTGFVGWGNCLTPPQPFESVCLPAMGIMMDGFACCPEPPRHACCIGEECYVTTEEDCLDFGGEWHPEWTDCGPPNPCLPPENVCCIDDDCLLMSQDECDDLGGEFFPEHWDCGPSNPCLLRGVCCVGDECYVATEEECQDLGGDWHPEWPNCGDRNPCASLRVCCVGPDCSMTSDYECYLLGGDWHPEWDSCDPNPCDDPVAVDFVTDVSIRQEEFAVVLRWHAVPDPRVTEYQVLRGRGWDGPGELLERITPTAESDYTYRDATVLPRSHYRYWVAAHLGDGSPHTFGPWSITVTGALRPMLLPISPNPFATETTIRFYLPTGGNAKVVIYGANGRLVHSARSGVVGPGVHDCVWNGRDAAGHALGGGVYWVRLQVGRHEDNRKVVILR